MSGLLPFSPGLFALIVVALAIGWLLGRSERGGRRAVSRRAGYVRGLDYLLNEQDDTAMDAFVESLEVNDDTVDTHLALGALVRRRGEVDKAIRVHQNLLARPRLSAPFRARAELELARDYLAAGLLGRAESLLRELAGRGGALREPALEYLLEIHQRERDWDQAIDIARELAGRGEPDIHRTLAHYLCELAAGELEAGNIRGARRRLEQALERDDRCVRASLMSGRLEADQGSWKQAIRILRRVFDQDPRFLPEALPDLVAAHAELGTERNLVRFLEHCVVTAPRPALVTWLADRIAARSGDADARSFLAGTLARHPDVRGLHALLERCLEAPFDDETRAALSALAEFTGALVAEAPDYACEQCGFSGRILHWQCPSCRGWGTTVPADRLAGL